MQARLGVGWHRTEVPLIVSIRKAGSITILDLSGPLRLGESEQVFRQHMEDLLTQGIRQIAVNLAGVPQMDSSGIGSIVRAFTQVKKAGGRCTFVAPTKVVLQLIQMVRLDSVLDILPDEAALLARG